VAALGILSGWRSSRDRETFTWRHPEAFNEALGLDFKREEARKGGNSVAGVLQGGGLDGEPPHTNHLAVEQDSSGLTCVIFRAS